MSEYRPSTAQAVKAVPGQTLHRVRAAAYPGAVVARWRTRW